MKVSVTLTKKEILAAIAQAFVDRGVPLIAGEYRLRTFTGSNEFHLNEERWSVEATVTYEADSLSSTPRDLDDGSAA